MTEDKKPTDSNNSFEKAYSELENIVKRMEMGDQGLEDSLSDFEQGIQLIQQCHNHLKKAEQRIEVIKQNDDGTINSKPLDSDSE